MMPILANLLVHLSSFVVLVCTLLSINEMTAATNHLIRAAYCFMATAAVACIFGDLTGAWKIGLPCAMAMIGMAILLVADRRKRWAAPRTERSHHAIH